MGIKSVQITAHTRRHKELAEGEPGTEGQKGLGLTT